MSSACRVRFRRLTPRAGYNLSVHKSVAVAIACLIPLSAPAQKKPVTIEAITATRTVIKPGPVQWAPDGKRFAYEQDKEIWIYDAPSGTKRQLVSFRDLEAKAVKVLSPEAFDWQNRRISEQSFRWSGSGKEMLASAGGDLFLVHIDSGKWDQLTATPDAERDPKLSPDGRFVSFRRDHDLYCLEIGSVKVTRLTQDGSPTLLNGELDDFIEALQVAENAEKMAKQN